MSAGGSTNERLVADLFGDGAVAYLKRKHTGGESGAKGIRYEDVFALLKVAECARALEERCHRVVFEAQAAMHFIDDLVIIDQENQVQRCHQLKNSPNVVWGGGERCVRTDFANQAQLSFANGYAGVELVLVVSDRDQVQGLAENIPAEIAETTRVVWFPWEEPLTLLCEKWEGELQALAWLSKHAAPNFQELAEVLGVMYGAWVMCEGPVSAFDVIARARSQSPTLIRPLVADAQIMASLSSRFHETLAKIDNFSYSIVKGFFNWEISYPNGSVARGIFPQDCLSEQFRKFQERVVKRSPATSEQIEEELP